MRTWLRLVLIMIGLAASAAAARSPFAQIGGARPVRPAADQPLTAVTLRMPVEDARRSVAAYLTAQGFEANDASRSATAVSYVRVADRNSFDALADCHGPAVGSPQLWLETLEIDLTPVAGGEQMRATGQFQVILTGLVSGAPFKLSCRSRGALESQVREAILGN